MILAVPAAIAARIVPALIVPDRYAPIVNAHFRCDAPAGAPLFVGIIGGTAEWIFRKREVLSVTVSAADRIVDRPAAELRDLFWRDVALAYRLPAHPVPPARIVKERRATFRASPEQLSAPSGGRPRCGRIFYLQAIMSILACPQRSKALFAPALPRRGCVIDARDQRSHERSVSTSRCRTPTTNKNQRALP